MKKAAVFLMLLALAGCITIPILPGLPSIPGATITNAPPATVSGQIAAGSFFRPTISAGQNGSLYIAAEGPGMASICAYTNTGKGWTGGEIVHASKDTAGRCYVADSLPAIYSWRWGKKEYGKLHGPGLYRAGKVEYPSLTTGAARLAASPDGPILMSKNGAWMNLSTGVRGQFNAGETGEKFDLAISGSTWATAMNGYSVQASTVSINGKRQVWADHATYPDQGNDLCYPSVLIAKDGSVWCASVYAGRLKVQQVVNGKLRWPITALGDLGPAILEQRCPPRLIALPDGPTAIWRQGRDIVRVNIERALAGTEKPAKVASGQFPDATVGPDGRVHLVYVANGGLQYKELAP